MSTASPTNSSSQAWRIGAVVLTVLACVGVWFAWVSFELRCEGKGERSCDRETLYVKLSGQSSYRLVVMLMPLVDGQADPTTFPGVVALDNW